MREDFARQGIRIGASIGVHNRLTHSVQVTLYIHPAYRFIQLDIHTAWLFVQLVICTVLWIYTGGGGGTGTGYCYSTLLDLLKVNLETQIC
jgi:hypothetical protein